MSTMATVGYGDVIPIQIPEKMVAMAGMLIGVTVFACDPEVAGCRTVRASLRTVVLTMHSCTGCLLLCPWFRVHRLELVMYPCCWLTQVHRGLNCGCCRYIMSTMNELMGAFNTQSLRNQELQRQLDSFCRVHKYDTYRCCMCCLHACHALSVP